MSDKENLGYLYQHSVVCCGSNLNKDDDWNGFGLQKLVGDSG